MKKYINELLEKALIHNHAYNSQVLKVSVTMTS